MICSESCLHRLLDKKQSNEFHTTSRKKRREDTGKKNGLDPAKLVVLEFWTIKD
jgi:hypothetical protein